MTEDYGRRLAQLRAERAAAARELRARGLVLRSIARELGIGLSTVADDLRKRGDGHG